MTGGGWDERVSAAWALSSGSLADVAIYASEAEGQISLETPATFEPPQGSSARCEVAIDLAGRPEVRLPGRQMHACRDWLPFHCRLQSRFQQQASPRRHFSNIVRRGLGAFSYLARRGDSTATVPHAQREGTTKWSH